MSEKDSLSHKYFTRSKRINTYNDDESSRQINKRHVKKQQYSKHTCDLRTCNIENNKDDEEEKTFKNFIDSYVSHCMISAIHEESYLTKNVFKSKKQRRLKNNSSENKSSKKNNISDIKITISNLDYIASLDSDEDEDFVLDKLSELPSKINYYDNERDYVDSLDEEERKKLIKKEYELMEIGQSKKPIRFKILELTNLSMACKHNIIEKIDRLYSLDSTDNEFSKLSSWLRWLEKIPFDTIHSLPVNNNSSDKDIYSFLKDTKDILDSSVYGHQAAKEQILTTLAQIISNSDTKGRCIAIQGPMGNGKTTLVKHGICKALKRPFGFTALGGTTDSNFMLGHDYTYEGSKPGRIIEMLTEAQCMNPILYFDELDKISDTPKGEEISNLLCHLTDFSQNTDFQDKYLSGVNIDLSKVIFIFSYNDPSKINPILLDRMYKIQTKGFKLYDKTKITNSFLIPEILKEFGLDKGSITINDETIKYIIENYTDNEEGVRNLRRNISDIISKINILNLINSEFKDSGKTDIVSFDIKDFKLPMNISIDIVNTLLGIKEVDTSFMGLYS